MDDLLPNVPVWLALLLLNVGAFALFGLDKRQAVQGGARIEERRLILLAIIGGSLGAKLGQIVFRHKSVKPGFRHILTGILVAHAALALYLAQ
ncbi:protein of unknown function DUF1294 [Dinoroseobacter shibae DFL 12 = DSM 16493]|jgi:uncharacterized membrane protein YsdA (DUF1294 family)|uniref:DUF1294 domain-containing protein n=1 Tax=Dinoroseobacter shibae (strain DSM 16493 / NCIMB 14021 / DFL 12) TaxID=398580 RepID=A8LL27_DINSH|nr:MULTISPECIES: DUF1294 domain-containing protein [Dinoroseobacter]ABV94776.1 protein of unknown function DUF1294 [Dinoroseobacter shibae DFL 12 = DSM 16493]MDD9716782.1 DUF1294 domain-containing protein [Dinoroseobacter sp. PD6]URF46196.1 DUF1294 domain-containing protein [Dinoroseobacter shibae]URF50503.1 DUF1294 domain-containing protein [Dinoroseobacter shibae]